ncbi:MAG: lipopeptide [Oleiphilus sp.]|nr:MAG: lipopeptide [Oleiphilus sp.]
MAVILIGLIGASLSGCGQKKSLYLPDKQAASEQRKTDTEDQSAEAGKSSY